MLPETEEYLGYTIRYTRDEDPQDPLEDDRLGTMAFCHQRYSLGDKNFSSFEEISSQEDYKNGISLPIYMYDHSGYTIRTTPFSCPWDSGLVGYIYVSKEKIRKEFNVSRVTKKIQEKVLDILVAEVAIYNAYLEGEVYEWRVDNEDCGCGGYIVVNKKDEESIRDEARTAVMSIAEKNLEKAEKEQTIDSFPTLAA